MDLVPKQVEDTLEEWKKAAQQAQMLLASIQESVQIVTAQAEHILQLTTQRLEAIDRAFQELKKS